METIKVTNAWVYYSFLLIILVFGLLFSKYEYVPVFSNGKYKRNKNLMVISFILIGYITFWAAVRNGVADTSTYIYGYETINSNVNILEVFRGEDKAPLFTVYQIVLKRLGFDYHLYLASIAVISGICIAYGIGVYTESVFFSAFVFVASTNFMWMFNGIRQFLVVAIIFALTRLIVEKKLIKFLIVVFIMYFVHNSCIIMIPIYFILNFKPWSWKIAVCILTTMVIVLLFPQLFVELLDSSMKDYNLAEQMQEDDGVNILRVLVAAVPAILAFMYRDRIRAYNNRYVDLWVNASVATTCLYSVGVISSGIFVGRLPIYTEIYNVLLLPFILKRIIPKESKMLLYIACVGFYMLFFYLMTKNLYYTTDLFASMNLKSF